jgi:hypothetical protein
MSHVETTAFVDDVPEIDGQRAVAVGKQRFVKHLAVSDSGRSTQWQHAETFAETCDACRVIIQSIGLDAFTEQLAKEAPLE